MFKLEACRVQYFVNGKAKVRDLSILDVRGLDITLDGTICGKWSSRRKTSIPKSLSNAFAIAAQVQALFGQSEAGTSAAKGNAGFKGKGKGGRGAGTLSHKAAYGTGWGSSSDDDG